MVFRCAALSVQRRQHASLFSPSPESLRDFMGQDPKREREVLHNLV